MEMTLIVALEELHQGVTLNGDHHGCRRDQGSIVDDHTLKKLFWIKLLQTAVLPEVR